MNSLFDQQKNIHQALLDGQFNKVTSLISGGGQLSEEEALNVYRRGYFARLTESLGDTFEAVWWVLGDENFFNVANDYIETHPSESYNLSDYGEHFSKHLKHSKFIEDLPFLAELARFEWQFKNLFHLDETKGLTEFNHVTPSSQFHFSASAQLFESPFSILEIWKLRATDSHSLPDIDVSLPTRALIYKQKNDIYTLELNPEAFMLFSLLMAQNSLEKALEMTAKNFESLTPELVSEIFSILAETQIVTETLCTAPVIQI